VATSALRKRKIESLILEELGQIISRGRVKDPRLQGIYSISAVSLSGDLKDAEVTVSVVDAYTGREQEADRRLRKSRQDVIDALNHAAGYLQGLIGRQIRLRSTPRLRFRLDTEQERGFNLIRKIEGLGG
jgi:ribosome-binding factor A